MADISFYKYLEAAFRYKLFNPEGQRASFDTHFNHLNYNLTYKQIFFYARKVLPKFYTSEFPDTEEGNLQMAKKVLEKLDKHQDTQLENQFKAITISEENAQIVAEAQAQSQQTEAQQVPPAETSAGTSFSLPDLPSAPSISSGSRRVYNIPHTPSEPQTPQPKIIIANKSGAVAEPPPPKSELVAANKSGVVKETPPPKIYIANKSGTVVGEQSIPSSAPQRFSWRGFKMPASFTNAAKNFGSAAQRFIGTNLGKIGRSLGEIAGGIGRGIAGPGLTGAYNLLGKAANGGLNAFERITRPGGIGGGGIGKGLSKSSNKFALGLIGTMLFFVLFSSMLGGLAGTTPTGEATPIAPISTDISSCKFTRVGNSLPIKSSILLGWVNNAAASAGIPSQILASVAMHESQDFVANVDNNHDAIKSNNYCIKGLMFCEKSGQVFHSKPNEDDPCTPEEIANGAKTAQAVGLMQNIDIYNPGKNLCSITENLNIAAAKLKANGLTQQPTQDQVNVAIGGYYNSCAYGNYSYCNEVWQDLQNCQAQSQTVPPPPADGNYKKWVGDFGININDGFVPDVYKWAYEVLASTPSVAPKFQTLLGTSPIEVKPICGISKTEGRTIFLRNRMVFCVTASTVPQGPTIEIDLFKQVLIHELGHIIYNTDRGGYNTRIIQARTQDNGLFLTAYSQNAASAEDLACGQGDDDGNRAGEDFAESISYFINNGITAKDYGTGCGILADELNLNPFDIKVNGQRKYPAHYQFMTELLK